MTKNKSVKKFLSYERLFVDFIDHYRILDIFNVLYNFYLHCVIKGLQIKREECHLKFDLTSNNYVDKKITF
ncbi:MAG: hypothetical protein H6Q52_786 [Deltaproteobacteria bacterium]|nr:hypothetical protein [Deltaproteobacteria bacterium]